MNLWIDHWGESRFFALYDGDTLVGMFVYKTGAEHVKRLLGSTAKFGEGDPKPEVKMAAHSVKSG